MTLSVVRCESANAILPSPLGGDGCVSSWLHVQVSKEQTGFNTPSCDQSLARKLCCAHSHFWNVNMGSWFPSLLRADPSPVFSAVCWWSSWIHKLGKSKLYLSLNGRPHYKRKWLWQSHTLHGTAASRSRYQPQVMATSGGSISHSSCDKNKWH